MDKMQTVIKSEFEKATDVAVVNVEFTADERIIITTATDVFTMTIGSDDDEFVFVSRHVGSVVRFGMPADWDEAIDENNGS